MNRIPSGYLSYPEVLVSPKRNVNQAEKQSPSCQTAPTLELCFVRFLHLKINRIAPTPINFEVDFVVSRAQRKLERFPRSDATGVFPINDYRIYPYPVSQTRKPGQNHRNLLACACTLFSTCPTPHAHIPAALPAVRRCGLNDRVSRRPRTAPAARLS